MNESERLREGWRGKMADTKSGSLLTSPGLQKLAHEIIATPSLHNLLVGMHLAIAEQTSANRSFSPHVFDGLMQFYPLVKSLAKCHDDAETQQQQRQATQSKRMKSPNV